MIRSNMVPPRRKRGKTALMSARRITDRRAHKILPLMLAEARAGNVGAEEYCDAPFAHPSGGCCGGWENHEKAAGVLAVRVHEQEREIRYLRHALAVAGQGSLVRREAFHSRRFR